MSPRVETWWPERRRTATVAVGVAAGTAGYLFWLSGTPWWVGAGLLYLVVAAGAQISPVGVTVQVLVGQALVIRLLLEPDAPDGLFALPAMVGVIVTAELSARVARLDSPIERTEPGVMRRAVVMGVVGAGSFAVVLLVAGTVPLGGVVSIGVASAACLVLAWLLITWPVTKSSPIPLLLLFATTLSAGCGDTPFAGWRANLPTDTLATQLVIGTLEGDGPEAFGDVSGLLSDSTGRIFVADGRANAIQVFSPAGDFEFSIGREGQGPGGLRSPCCIAWGPDGRLWVRDVGNSRYSVFEVRADVARFERTVQMVHGDPGRPSPTTFRDTLLADIGMTTGPEGQRQVTRHWVTPSGEVVGVEEFRSPPPEELGGRSVTTMPGVTHFLYQPFGPVDLLEFGPGGSVISGVSSEYHLWLTAGDRTAVRLERPSDGPPLTQTERSAGTERLEQLARRIDGSVGDLPFGLPSRKPPIHDVYFDERGNIWVELSVREGAPRQAEIWSPDGELLSRVAWPPDVILSAESWIGPDRVIGVWRDELGVSYVVVLRR